MGEKAARLNNGRELPPVAPILMQSLRAFGYTAASALADLVDNSIAAGARRVHIKCVPGAAGFVSVVDDGHGMNAAALVEAMRFGSQDPRDERLSADLGRFGLGLKTASLSQCRRLTVASRSGGPVAVARWDLDECDVRGTWWLDQPAPEELPAGVFDALMGRDSGTAVVWEKLDRLGDYGANQEQLDRAINESADHLALVFHRFLSGEMAPFLEIQINNRPLPALDPFLEGHVKGQSLFGESMKVEGHDVVVSPFVLPYPQRLKAEDVERAGGRERLKVGHGFYIYRGGRLVVPGGWHRIVPADDMVRLARIRVDVPVALDHIWKVDVRKASAEPPPQLRPHLKRLVAEAAERSRSVISFRAKPKQGPTVPVWKRLDGRDGAASWQINADHPLVSTLVAGLDADERRRLFRLLEQELPLQAIHIHLSNDLTVTPPDDESVESLETLARRIVEGLAGDVHAIEAVLDQLPSIEPFSHSPEEARAVAATIRAERSAP